MTILSRSFDAFWGPECFHSDELRIVATQKYLGLLIWVGFCHH